MKLQAGLAMTMGSLALSLACGDGGREGTGGDSAESVGSLSETGGQSATDTNADATAGEASMSSAGSGGSSGDASASADGDSDGTKFDFPPTPDAGSRDCTDGGGGGVEFSYIWVCNSSEGTISKINTETMIEEGRYRTRMDNAGSPSRTSVNLSGDVAVANRVGGVTKLYARDQDCADTNGMPGIQTSTGKNDVLAWGTEECVAWHTPFAYTTQRPVAWAPGTLNRATCEYENQMLWTAGGQSGVGNSLEVVRLNGDDGTIDATVAMPDVPIGYFGAYGGAVNQQGDFWFVIYDTYDVAQTYMVRVDNGDLSYDMVAVPDQICPYGFTVDSQGRPWIGSFCVSSARYTPGTDTWDLFNALGYGIQEDAEGRMWMADYALPGVREIDSDTLVLGAQIQIPGASSPKGISIDFAGKVWVVDMFQSAFRVDPDTQTWDVYNQLNGPYTYSDMTGWGLNNVTFPPG